MKEIVSDAQNAITQVIKGDKASPSQSKRRSPSEEETKQSRRRSSKSKSPETTKKDKKPKFDKNLDQDDRDRQYRVEQQTELIDLESAPLKKVVDTGFDMQYKSK